MPSPPDRRKRVPLSAEFLNMATQQDCNKVQSMEFVESLTDEVLLRIETVVKLNPGQKINLERLLKDLLAAAL